MEVRMADNEDPKGYKTWEEMEAEWEVERKLQKERKASSVLWKIWYDVLVQVYYWIARIDLFYEFRKFRWFFVRGWKGWAPNDTWCFHGYLAKVIKEGCQHLKEIQHGHPGNMTEEEWDKILDEIIWSFDMVNKISESDVYMYIEEWGEEKNKEMEKTLSDMAVENGYEPYYYMSKEEHERMQKGLKLFIENIWSLWD